ncbi:MAG: carboxypeptidase M32 [Alphaproteobacteria bacterium]|nr:carboxypeptidase M32 [Alphaproteobacteria bacterium]
MNDRTLSKNPYQQLEEIFRQVALFQEVIQILDWDTNTMMPVKAAVGRGQQEAFLKVKLHQCLTDPRLVDLLDKAESQKHHLTSWQQANLREMYYHWLRASALPDELVHRLAVVSNNCEKKWRIAKKEANFSLVQHELAELIVLTKEEASIKAERLGCKPYEALISQYEPGIQIGLLDRIFDDLAEFLPPVIAQITPRQSPKIRPSINQTMPIEQQDRLIRAVIQKMTFDFQQGRVDQSLHPFSSSLLDDMRITVAFKEQGFLVALMAAIHEIGHAFYEGGLPKMWRYQPVGWARGMALHESQSLIWEMMVARTTSFWGFMTTQMTQHAPELLTPVNLNALVDSVTQVRPGLIRVEADMVTYPLHIILRYWIERALFSNQLAVHQIPEVWNTYQKQLLGVLPNSDSDGCLQDIHWYSGSFGYFPTYTFGALIAAQLFETAIKQMPTLLQDIQQGNFHILRSWLTQNVHQQASSGSTEQILKNVTGQGLSTEAYKRNVKQRYDV